MTARGCSVDGCTGTIHGHGYCSPHYNRWRRHGDPLAGMPIRSLVTDPADCLTCLDVGWLLEVGEHPDNIAARIGIRHNSLITHLRRHQRPDLLERLTRERQRTAA